MNATQGLRRLAILFGAIGVLVAGIVSYSRLQPLLQQRTMHQRFEQLSALDSVKQQGATLQARASATGKFLLEWEYLGAKLGRDGVDKVYWTENFKISEIDTDDDSRIFPVPDPTIWPYALYLIAGFAIPWGIVRGIGWVGDGFIKTQ